VPELIRVIGLDGDRPAAPVRGDLVAGGSRQLAAAAPAGARTVVIRGDLAPVLDAIEAEPGTVCIITSGDPGFFGIVRALAARFGPDRLQVHPAPSSVALAFARLGLPWDDAVVVSAHGRPAADAISIASRAPKAAVLTAPDCPPELLGKELLAAGAHHTRAAVCTRLGLADEVVHVTDLEALARSTWDPLAVVVLLTDPAVGEHKSIAWGLPDEGFAHRDGMITKSEVRAVALGKLSLPGRGVLWDVGAGSGSVAIECARLRPGVDVIAVERKPDDATRIRTNARRIGATLRVIEGEAPAALRALPDPDRAFVGGGGLDVLDAVLARLRPDGVCVATFAALDRAAQAATRLGSLVQIAVSRGQQLPDGGWRLAAENPVFVVWGPGGARP
jgi:precorrin-6Y C5,15-methyltransferase (decarboxylating)